MLNSLVTINVVLFCLTWRDWPDAFWRDLQALTGWCASGAQGSLVMAQISLEAVRCSPALSATMFGHMSRGQHLSDYLSDDWCEHWRTSAYTGAPGSAGRHRVFAGNFAYEDA
jgi:hypothetical protein